jgi:predicted RNase H-like nuclease (RuvC/YqgF family)
MASNHSIRSLPSHLFQASITRWCDVTAMAHQGETMARTKTGGVPLLHKLEGLERRLETLTDRVKSLERHTAELDDLRREIGNLKIEVEEFREGES